MFWALKHQALRRVPLLTRAGSLSSPGTLRRNRGRQIFLAAFGFWPGDSKACTITHFGMTHLGKFLISSTLWNAPARFLPPLDLPIEYVYERPLSYRCLNPVFCRVIPAACAPRSRTG